VIGTLPYNNSTPLFLQMLEQIDRIDRMVFMFQREVVDRLTAVPATKAYGKLSVVTQLKCRARLALEVPPQAFWPEPKVDSAVVVLDPIPQEARLMYEEQTLTSILSAAFNQRRKTLRNSLKSLVSEGVLISLGIDPNARAETLTPETYASLSLHLAGRASGAGTTAT
jgi:16S rRNA (adenine1518-N6/adenine1519-N6)-dimethyltransferase